jgi:hypothetical protein
MVEEQHLLFKDQCGYTRTALEYAHNQTDVLKRSSPTAGVC